MSESLALDLNVLAEWLHQITGGPSTPGDPGKLLFARHCPYGTADGQVSKRWASTRTLAAAATETLDLQSLAYSSGGVSGTISFSKVRLIFIAMLTDVAGLQIGGTAASEWSAPWPSAGEGQKCGAGSPAVLADLVDGWDVSAGAKGLLLTNLSATDPADFTILIVGN
jgi:hypothetical protein